MAKWLRGVLVEKLQMSNACVKCGRQLQRQATGRPAEYCSPACRRSAEFELRRLNARLDRLETEQMHIRLHGKSSCYRIDGDARTAEIRAIEERLRELMTAGADADPAGNDDQP